MTRRRFFALPGVMLAALPQMPWETHRDRPAMTPEELTDGYWQHNAAINSHTMMHGLHNGRFQVIESKLSRGSWVKPAERRQNL